MFLQGEKLRQLIDDRYTASGLLGLSNTVIDKSGDQVALVPSSQICNNYYHQVLAENNWLREGSVMMGLPFVNMPMPVQTEKRVRRSGKYTPQEREHIRRERNRMHAKKTRDRKKFFLETSEKIIQEMEAEANAMRLYLLQLGVLSKEECSQLYMREMQSHQELLNLKASSSDMDGDDPSSSSGEMNAEGEDHERVSTWSGSNDGSSSSHPSNTSSANDSSQTSRGANRSDMGSNSTSSASACTSSHNRRLPSIAHSDQSATTAQSRSSRSDDRRRPERSASGQAGSGGEEFMFDAIQRHRGDPKESYHHGLAETTVSSFRHPHKRQVYLQHCFARESAIALDSLSALASAAAVSSSNEGGTDPMLKATTEEPAPAPTSMQQDGLGLTRSH
jgi:hypothetical protein